MKSSAWQSPRWSYLALFVVLVALFPRALHGAVITDARYSEAELDVGEESQFEALLFWVDVDVTIHLATDGKEITDLSLADPNADKGEALGDNLPDGYYKGGEDMPEFMMQQRGAVKLVCDCAGCTDPEFPECNATHCVYDSTPSQQYYSEGPPRFFIPLPSVQEPASTLFSIFAGNTPDATAVHQRFVGVKIIEAYDHWRDEDIMYIPDGLEPENCKLHFTSSADSSTGSYFVQSTTNGTARGTINVTESSPLGPLVSGYFAEATYTCNYGEISAIFSALLADIDKIDDDTQGHLDNGRDGLESATWNLASYETREGWIGCYQMADSMVTMGEANRTFKGDRGCYSDWDTDDWKTDPCCNWELQFEQCCIPRTFIEEIEVIVSIDTAAVTSSCREPERAVRTLELFMENDRKAEDCEDNAAEYGGDMDTAWPKLTRFIETCWEEVYGTNGPPTCRTDEDCYTSCAADRGECVVPWDNPAPAMRACFVDNMNPELERYLRKKWGLTGASPDSEFEAAFSTNLEDLTCVGPTSWEFDERWETVEVDNCDNETDSWNCWCWEDIPWGYTNDGDYSGDWDAHCPYYDPGLGDMCVPAPHSMFCDIQPAVNQSSECLLVPLSCLQINDPFVDPGYSLDPVTGYPYIDGCEPGTGAGATNKSDACNIAEWKLMCASMCKPCVLDVDGTSWIPQEDTCQGLCDTVHTECDTYWGENSACSYDDLFTSNEIKCITASGNITCSDTPGIAHNDTMKRKRSSIPLNRALSRTAHFGHGHKQAYEKQHGQVVRKIHGASQAKWNLASVRRERLSRKRGWQRFNWDRSKQHSVLRVQQNYTRFCYKNVRIPADESGCTNDTICNWADWVSNTTECGTRDNGANTTHFCGECSGPWCWEVSEPSMCYTWVWDPSECTALGGQQGMWGPWHCVFPDDEGNKEACLPSEYCYEPPEASTYLDDMIGYQDSCGGVCVATNATNQTECDDLNTQQKRWARGVLKDTVFKGKLTAEGKCAAIYAALKKGHAERVKDTYSHMRWMKARHQTVTQKKLAVLHKQLSSAARACKISLEIQAEDLYSVIPEEHLRQANETGMWDWNGYWWESNVKSGNGYCQVWNLWGPDSCTGSELLWVPWRTYQRGMFENEGTCTTGRCSIDHRMTESECTSFASCNKPCGQCRSREWESTRCYDSTLTNSTDCANDGGEINNDFGYCEYAWISDSESCYADEGAENSTKTFETCKALDREACSLCDNDGTCSLNQTILDCHISQWESCETEEQCVDSGLCEDWELENWQNSLCWNENAAGCPGVCIKDFDMSNGYPDCNWNAGEGWSQMGCIDFNVISASNCPGSNGTWFSRAYTKSECHAHGTGCDEPRFWGFTPKDQATCEACDGDMEPYYRWRDGHWITGSMVPLDWKARGMNPINDWAPALNWTKLHWVMEHVIGRMMSKALKAQSECKYSLISANIMALACDCGTLGINETCSFDALLIASIGEGEFFSGLDKKLGWGDVIITVHNDTIPTIVDSSTISMSMVTDLESLLDSEIDKRQIERRTRLIEVNVQARERAKQKQKQKQKRKGYEPKWTPILRADPTPADYAIVTNDLGAIVGQLVGTGFSLTFGENVTEGNVIICLPIDEDIPVNTVNYTEPDFAEQNDTVNPTVWKALGVSDAVIEDEVRICGTVSSSGMYFPIYRAGGNWTTQLPCPLDHCGICEGDNSTCAGCDNIPYSGLVFDACATPVCGGNNSTCLGCDFVPNSALVDDRCGVCDGDNTTCPCDCELYLEPHCDVPDLCYSVTCENAGVCDPSTGFCTCPAGYTGPYCEVLDCNAHGTYSTTGSACVCHAGWDTATDCSTCAKGPSTGYTFICAPSSSSHASDGYILVVVADDKVDNWLAGKRGQAKALDYAAILPNTTDHENVTRDCRCYVVLEQEKKKKNTDRPLANEDKDAYHKATKKMARRFEVQKKNKNANLAQSLHGMVVRRANKFPGLAVSPEEYKKGWARSVQARTIELPEFLEEAFETCIEEYEGTEEEMEALSEFYEECLDELYEGDDDDDDVATKWYFWLLLILAICGFACASVCGCIAASLWNTSRIQEMRIAGFIEERGGGAAQGYGHVSGRYVPDARSPTNQMRRRKQSGSGFQTWG